MSEGFSMDDFIAYTREQDSKSVSWREEHTHLTYENFIKINEFSHIDVILNVTSRRVCYYFESPFCTPPSDQPVSVIIMRTDASASAAG